MNLAPKMIEDLQREALDLIIRYQEEILLADLQIKEIQKRIEFLKGFVNTEEEVVQSDS